MPNRKMACDPAAGSALNLGHAARRLHLTRRVALFSINKWPYFRLSRFRQDAQSGLVFGQQMALFSIDKNSLDLSRACVSLLDSSIVRLTS